MIANGDTNVRATSEDSEEDTFFALEHVTVLKCVPFTGGGKKCFGRTAKLTDVLSNEILLGASLRARRQHSCASG